MAVAAGAADRHGRFVVTDDQLSALLAECGDRPGELSVRVAGLAHLDVVGAFECRWDLVDL